MARSKAPNAQKTCGGCSAVEGEYHAPGCDYEWCPFCGGQLSSCGCCYKPFYPNYRNALSFIGRIDIDDKEACAEACGLPLDVYMNGLPKEQEEEFDRILQEKGLVPYISYPIVCARCGALWPELFMVPDAEWEKYIQIRERDKVICRPCYDRIKRFIDTKGSP